MKENKYSDAVLERLQSKIFAFMDDVRRRTRIFEGRRSVEEQLSEEYHGRFLIELIQNADDACGQEGEIFIVVRQGPSQRVVVFNTGRGFTPSNFESLCTMGLTDKKPEEAIGNKGLGFRSVLEVCKSPVIYSSDADRPENAGPCFDGYCFCFSPDDLTDALRKAAERTISGNGISQIEVAGRSFKLLETIQSETVQSLKKSLENPETLERVCKILPVYEMPIPIAPSDQLLPWASSKGAATAVSIEIKPGAEGILQKALAEVNPYTFLFLRNAKYIYIYLENPEGPVPYEVAEFKRIIPQWKGAGGIRKGLLEVKYHDKTAWAVVCGKSPEDFKDESQGWMLLKKLLARADFEDSLKGLPERWQDIKQIEVEIAVPIGAHNEEGRFSIYLPTLAKTGTGAWVNAPFYGKIDRTGINWGHKWNSRLRDHAVACVAEMATLLLLSPDIESGQAILHLLGIKDQNQAVAQAQISSESIQRIIKEKAWVLCEPDSKGMENYGRLSDIVLPKHLEWDAKPVETIMEIFCREQIPIICPHPKLMEPSQGIIENTAKIYETLTKEPSEEELARLAEIAIQKTPRNKQDRQWWNTLYRWLGRLDISYDALVGKRLICTQAGIYKVERDSRIFSPPRRLAASGEEDTPMIKKFQELLTSSLPEAFRDRVAFLHPEIDLGDKYIRSFLIREYRGESVVMEFRTKEIVEFILNHISPELYRPRMSKKRKREAAEVFVWAFILWRQMRGEGLYVDWSQLLVPTTTGWLQANETYAGRAWTNDEGADLEKIFQGAEPPKPFLPHPNNLFQILPKTFKELIQEYDLEEDLKDFVLDVLGVWTAPRIIVKKAARPGGYPPEFCPTGSFNSLDTSPLSDLPEKHDLPIDKEIWAKYLQTIERKSKGKPFQMYSRYVLEEVAYIEDLKIPGKDPKALARCLDRGWDKYYKDYATVTIRRHPSEGGQQISWSVPGFVAEQLKEIEWIPVAVWATRAEDEREISQEFDSNARPSQAVKVNKDLLAGGSAVIYSLLPHISPDVEQYFSEDLCQKVGITLYSPSQKEVQNPFHIIELISQAHSHLPNGREHFLLSLWQDLFDAAVTRFGQEGLPADKPIAALGFEVQKEGGKRYCWLKPVADEGAYTAWVNDNDDCLSMLPPGTLIACAGKGKTHFDSRAELLKHILQKTDIRRLSELKVIPHFGPVNGWEIPMLLSDAFPWVISPALAVLAFGRQTSQPMSVSNPKGEFQGLVSRIRSARVQYTRNLRIRLEGLDMMPEPRRIFYSPSENLLLLDADAELRLRDLSPPLTILFDREDYLKPAELWLWKVEEATCEGILRQGVPPGIAIKELGIEPTSLQELFQVIGGETQQILRSVAPALFFALGKGKSPLSAQKFNSLILEIADRGKPYDLAEEEMTRILAESGILDHLKYAHALRKIVEQTRDPVEIAKKAYELLEIDLGDWNTAAQSIGAREQIVANQGGIEAFNKVKQDTKWAACGFLQTHLKDPKKEEFNERWGSYDSLKPSESIHQTWSPATLEIESPLIEWFKAQGAELLEQDGFNLIFSGKKPTELLEFIRNKYNPLGKDPDAVCTENIEALSLQWKRLRVALACLALRGTDSEAVMPHLRTIDEDAPGQWVMGNDRLQSRLSVSMCAEEEFFSLLWEWIATQAAPVKKLLEGSEANTLDEFVKNNKIRPDEEKKAAEILAKAPKILPKQTIAGKSLEIPEKDQPLGDLRKKLDETLRENNQEMLKRLVQDVDIVISTELGDAPVPHARTKSEGRRFVVSRSRDVEFIGYVGEYLIYRALKRRYPHIGLSNWVSGNKQRFFSGSKGDDSLGYDFCIPIDSHKVLIEVKSHTGDQSYFELGSSELDAAQEAQETGDIYQVWVIRNLAGRLDIDHIPNPMDKENRKHFRFEVGRVYYQTE